MLTATLRAAFLAVLTTLAPHAPAQRTTATQAPLALSPAPELGPGILRGHLTVWENRATRAGRTIDLHVVVLQKNGEPAEHRPDPVFFLAGGPGQAATSAGMSLRESWMRKGRDIVLVDQRGTGRSNPLRVELPGHDGDLQGYLEPIFQEAPFRRALENLSQVADLTQYTTEIAADDLDEVRQALGYERINLVGGSYGTRAALVTIRRHEKAVRSACLDGVAPTSFLNPLYHARSAQQALDLLFAEAKHPRYGGRFDDLQNEFNEVLRRLEREPQSVFVAHPTTRERVAVRLDRSAFCEALRVQCYYLSGNRNVPALIQAAYRGDLEPFASAGLQSNRALRNQLCFGMLMCVTGSEDIPRITEAMVRQQCQGTYLGDERVRQQMAVAAFWPRGEVAADYGKPLRAKTPVLLLSGSMDPVTPPEWGSAAARHMPNALHVVVPGCHEGKEDRCVLALKQQFLASASVKGLDPSCVAAVRLPPLRVR